MTNTTTMPAWARQPQGAPAAGAATTNKRDNTASVAEILAAEPPPVRRALEVLGQLLIGGLPEHETARAFLRRHLEADVAHLVCETRRLSPVGHITAGLAVADLIDAHQPELGPGSGDDPPEWGAVDIGDKHYTPPTSLSAFFSAGALGPAPIVLQITDSDIWRTDDGASLRAYTRPGDRAHGRAVIEQVLAAANGDKNLYRGKFLKVSASRGLTFDVTPAPTLARRDLVLREDIWAEIDLNIASVATARSRMNALKLGCRRGILLAGPPGVGKSAVSRVVAAELLGDFTVMLVDARAGSGLLSDVYAEAVKFGPTVVMLEDIDLLIDSRRSGRGDRGRLAEFLAVMDTDPDAPILTIASTNDVSTLDAAAVRAARFDSILEIGYPDKAAVAQILATYLHATAAAADVDVAAVAAEAPRDITGADLREVVRRTVLANSGEITTAGLLETVRSGRFRPAMPSGNYL
ncbi:MULTISPECIES: AAA family ATPase [Mycobacterium avium complex (MAC)]|nr:MULTISPECIES: ATP-binding protein [Mycobacterium avium complex (MAC)]